MSRRRKHRKAMAEMNVVPYIDVMLVLLVIFMVTAPMLQHGVEVNMPQADAESIETSNQKEPLYITIDEQGIFGINDITLSTSTEITDYIQQKIKQIDKQSVYIRADSGVPYQLIMQGLVAAQKAGVENVGLLAAPENH